MVIDYGVKGMTAGVDYITCTGRSPESLDRVEDYALHWIADSMQAGWKSTQQNLHGYKVTSCGHVSWGTGPEGWLCRLSSGMAREYWATVALFARSVTRLDLMLTVWYEHDQAHLAEELYEQVCRVGGLVGQKRALLMLNPTKGSTLYYGSRRSSQYGRYYDKYREQKMAAEWLNACRWEVEFKKPLSDAVAAHLLNEMPDQDAMGSIVARWFLDRSFPAPQICKNGENAIQLERDVTTTERRLAWLRKQVRPVYHQLHLDGWGIEADDALGLIPSTIIPVEEV